MIQGKPNFPKNTQDVTIRHSSRLVTVLVTSVTKFRGLTIWKEKRAVQVTALITAYLVTGRSSAQKDSKVSPAIFCEVWGAISVEGFVGGTFLYVVDFGGEGKGAFKSFSYDRIIQTHAKNDEI